jgi:hypothetical protein
MYLISVPIDELLKNIVSSLILYEVLKILKVDLYPFAKSIASELVILNLS